MVLIGDFGVVNSTALKDFFHRNSYTTYADSSLIISVFKLSGEEVPTEHSSENTPRASNNAMSSAVMEIFNAESGDQLQRYISLSFFIFFILLC